MKLAYLFVMQYTGDDATWKTLTSMTWKLSPVGNLKVNLAIKNMKSFDAENEEKEYRFQWLAKKFT